MEKLIYLFSNPYTWLFIIFTFSLPYILKYMRRFYPKKLQQQMAEEEACILEINTKPEMKAMRKNVFIGFVLSIIISYIISYYLIASVDNTLRTFTNIFIGLSSLVAIYAMVTEYKINKDKKNCSDIYDKREFFTQIGIYGSLVVLLIFIIVYFEIGRVR